MTLAERIRDRMPEGRELHNMCAIRLKIMHGWAYEAEALTEKVAALEAKLADPAATRESPLMEAEK